MFCRRTSILGNSISLASRSSVTSPSSVSVVAPLEPQGQPQRRPKHNNDEEDTDHVQYLATLMNELSVEQREQLYEEMHGIGQVVTETPGLIASKLAEVQDLLNRVPRRKRAALDQAIFLRPSLLVSPEVILLFLRACRFEADKTTDRLCKHYIHKLKLFGPDKLAKDITLQDLGDEEMRHMYEGSVQFLTANHRGHMATVSTVQRLKSGIPNVQAYARYEWYQTMALMEDVETQRKGVLEVCNACGDLSLKFTFLLEYLRYAHQMLADRPLRSCAMHILYDQPAVKVAVDAYRNIGMNDIRLRERLHYGSSIELQYALMPFGIQLPQIFNADKDEGIFARSYIDAYLENRRKKEAARERRENADPSRPLYPNPQDILMGRGRPYQSWSGNQRLLQLAADHGSQYDGLSKRADKTQLALRLLRIVQEEEWGRGRFLKRIDGVGWQVVDDTVAREKISQLLRSEARNYTRTKSESPLSEEERIEWEYSSSSATIFESDGADGGEVETGHKRARVG